jgi:hypothetical protein
VDLYHERAAAMNLIWSDDEREFVRANAALLHDAEIAARLTFATDRFVTAAAVRQQSRVMGIRKMPGRGVCRIDWGGASSGPRP